MRVDDDKLESHYNYPRNLSAIGMVAENPTASKPVVYKYIVQGKTVLLVMLDYGNPRGNFFFRTSGRCRFYIANKFRDQTMAGKGIAYPPL